MSSRPQSADACIQGYDQPAAITRHHTVDDLWWVQAEESLTSGFFLMWAVCVVLLGGVASGEVAFGDLCVNLYVAVAVFMPCRVA